MLHIEILDVWYEDLVSKPGLNLLMRHIPKTAILGLRNEDGVHGIPPDRVLDIAKKTTTCAFVPHFLGHSVTDVTYSDTDADFMLQPYKPVEPKSDETPSPHVQFSKWFRISEPNLTGHSLLCNPITTILSFPNG
jgi:hypothetical protein